MMPRDSASVRAAYLAWCSFSSFLLGDGIGILVSCLVDRNEGDLRHEDFEERVGHGPLLLDVAPDALELLLLLILLPRVEVHGATVDERCGWDQLK